MKQFISVIVKTATIWPPSSFVAEFQFLSLTLFKSINNSLWQDSFLVSIAGLDGKNLDDHDYVCKNYECAWKT